MSLNDKLKAMFGGQKDLHNHLNQQMSINNTSTFPDLQTQLDDFLKDQVGSSQQFTQFPSQTVTLPYTYTPQPQLSKEEEAELNDLIAQEKAETKRLKLERFKALPKDFRQYVVNGILWQEAVQDINAITPSRSQRLIELEAKKNFGSLYVGGIPVGIYNGTTTQFDTQAWISVGPGLPDGITKDELVQAHLDASLEDEIATEQGESKSE